ncbi:MAG: hypothetical protein HYS17_04585 [Micavibrio aeruginosavorus]|uniref:Uncharacterized protein n=1 Tax=Micavibrio aeruginosavorus TaxID=349221 RepID=A0A7T5R407_9BACT|nr:MAG: hypothetical protein HYS17_04585 [Micavibrio aeruginosavorus]
MTTNGATQPVQWDYQVRINLADSFATVARANAADPALKPLTDVLSKYNATIKNQFDAFADFCREAEANGQTDSDLYRWTKQTVDNPEKQARYATRFTVYADGGKEVYDRAIADGLEADLRPLLGGMITRINKFDSNPARNPQPPAQS